MDLLTSCVFEHALLHIIHFVLHLHHLSDDKDLHLEDGLQVCLPITDLSTVIALDETWDPDTLHSPLQDLIPMMESASDTIPFAHSLPQSVHVPTTDGAYKASLFDDIGRRSCRTFAFG
jgi:hypothetical protein